MKIVPYIARAGVFGTACALVLLGGIHASEKMSWSVSSGHGFRVDPDGSYHLNPCYGNDLYALSRRTDTAARTAHFLWWPLYDHYRGAWTWTGWGGSGKGRPDVPTPTEAQFAAAALELNGVYSGMEGLDYMKVCVPGGPYSQTIYHQPGVIALLTFSYLLAGPAALSVASVVRRRINARRTGRRAAAGLCPSCGYALAGVPAAERCPECGASR